MSKADKAKELFEGGCNCCQAVFCAFRDETNLSEEDALRLSAGFGGGMGRMREVCGAVSGMFMALGVLYGDYGTDSPDTKKQQYADVQRLAAAFEERNGSIICRDLLGLSGKSEPNPEKRTDEYYKKRPCSEMVSDAAEIFALYLKQNGRI